MRDSARRCQNVKYFLFAQGIRSWRGWLGSGPNIPQSFSQLFFVKQINLKHQRGSVLPPDIQGAPGGLPVLNPGPP